MNNTSPKYRRLAYHLEGLPWWQQITTNLTTPPRLELLEDWTIDLADGLRIVVPKGFVTDGASIPRILWPIIPPFGPLLEGAILHDFGYQHGYLLARYYPEQVYNLASMAMRYRYPDIFTDTIPVYIGKPQRFFDELLRHVAIEFSGATVQAEVAFRALLIFGGNAWARYRDKGPAAYNQNSLFLPGV